MNKLVIFEKKDIKIREKNYIEIDLDDLESLSNPQHGKDFLEIPEKMVGKKPFLNWFVVNNISFWWFVSPVIHPKYKEIIFFIDHLLTVLESNTPNLIRLEGIFDKLDIIKQICELKKIKLEISTKGYLIFKIKNFSKKVSKSYFYKQIMKKKFEKRIKHFRSSYQFRNPPPGYTLITSPGMYRRETIDPESGNKKKGEPLLYPILNMLKFNKTPKLLIDLDYSFRGSTNILHERLTEDNDWIPFEIILDSPKSKFVKNSISHLKKSISELMNHDLNEIFTHRKISVWNYIKPLFKEIFFEPYLPFYIHTIEKFEYFLKKTRPKVIIQLYETGPYAKAIEISAQKLGIKTIGIQHGLIPSDYPDYMFKEVKGKKDPFGNIIPDLTLVFGDYYKKLLTEKGSYPKDKVSVLGHPEYFQIDKIKKIIKRNDLQRQYDFQDKKVILVPLVARLSTITNNPYKIILDSLYNNLKENNYIILVRPHPGDKFTQKELQKLYPTKNFVISETSLIEDILLSNVVVTNMGSTVSTEAILFDRPVLLVDLSSKDHDEIDLVSHEMVEKKVAVLTSVKELIPKLKQLVACNKFDLEKKEVFLNEFFNLSKKIDLKKLIYE